MEMREEVYRLKGLKLLAIVFLARGVFSVAGSLGLWEALEIALSVLVLLALCAGLYQVRNYDSRLRTVFRCTAAMLITAGLLVALSRLAEGAGPLSAEVSLFFALLFSGALIAIVVLILISLFQLYFGVAGLAEGMGELRLSKRIRQILILSVICAAGGVIAGSFSPLWLEEPLLIIIISFVDAVISALSAWLFYQVYRLCDGRAIPEAAAEVPAPALPDESEPSAP